MTQASPKPATKKKSPGKSGSSAGKRAGYIIAIVVMVVMIYVLRHLREWGLTFLTEEFSKCLFYIELSIYLSIAAQVLFIFYDNKWFKYLVNAITSVASAIALIMVYVIFPFDIEDVSWIKWIKIGILLLFGLTVISIIVELVKGLRYLAKDPQAV